METENLTQNYIIVQPISSTQNLYYMKDGKFKEFAFHDDLKNVKEFTQFHDATEKIKTFPPGIYFCQRVFCVEEAKQGNNQEQSSTAKEGFVVGEKTDRDVQFELLLQVETELKEAEKLPFKERIKKKLDILDFVEIKRKSN